MATTAAAKQRENFRKHLSNRTSLFTVVSSGNDGNSSMGPVPEDEEIEHDAVGEILRSPTPKKPQRSGREFV
jgi:hypothetical protein